MTRKYGPKASEKIAKTLHEWKRGTLRSGSGGKVTSQKQAIAIGLSQARRAGGKVPPAPRHATMSLDARVRTYLSNMRPEQEIDANGLARVLHSDPLGVSYALSRAVKDGHATTGDGRWFGPARAGASHARKKSPAQLNREINASLAGSKKGSSSCGVRGCHCGCPSAHVTKRRSHATKAEASLFAVEIDPHEFEERSLPDDAVWRRDLVHLAEKELARGRTYRRPRDARYAVIEWKGYRGAVGRLLDWLEGAPGVTRYGEIYE